MIPKHRVPTHPGRILLKEFLEPMNLTQAQLARDLKTNEQKINTLIKGKRGVSAEMAWLLSAYFKTSPEFSALKAQLTEEIRVEAVRTAYATE